MASAPIHVRLSVFGLLLVAVPALLGIQCRFPCRIRRFVDQPVKAFSLRRDCGAHNARIGRPRCRARMRFLRPMVGLILGDLPWRLAVVSLLILTGNLPIGLLKDPFCRPDNAGVVRCLFPDFLCDLVGVLRPDSGGLLVLDRRSRCRRAVLSGEFGINPNSNRTWTCRRRLGSQSRDEPPGISFAFHDRLTIK